MIVILHGARDEVSRQFPHLVVGEGPADVRIGPGWLESAKQVYALDAAVARACTLEIAAGLELPVLTRYQRHFPRRNPHSARPRFDWLLLRHRALHDVSKPLVAADYAHALDVWQWLLRVAPQADLALQAAALFHDVERLSSEPEARVEHRASDYDAFKRAHARSGADKTRCVLDGVVDAETVERTAELVARHEQPDGDPSLALLNDADALSFFSLNSIGFLDYFGLDHTRKKVVWTLARMSPRARATLRTVGLSPALAQLVAAAQEKDAYEPGFIE